MSDQTEQAVEAAAGILEDHFDEVHAEGRARLIVAKVEPLLAGPESEHSGVEKAVEEAREVEEGDWPAVVLFRRIPGIDPENYEVYPTDNAPAVEETRRYVPAPTQPQLSDEDRERLFEIEVALNALRRPDDAAFLRKLASRKS